MKFMSIAVMMTLLFVSSARSEDAVEKELKDCELGSAISCNIMGNRYANSNDAQEQLKGASYYRKACDKDYATSCSNLAYLYLKGHGVSQDLSKAESFYRKACEMGETKACDSANLDALKAQHKAVVDAAQTARIGCDKKDADSCNTLARAYEDGEGVQKDFPKAVALYRKACDFGQAGGCISLGFMFKRGHGVEKDRTKEMAAYGKAVPLYLKGCNAGHGQSCNVLGTMYESGEWGVEKNLEKATDLYRKGCDLGHNGACHNSSRLAPIPSR
ncbi:MAG: tetratricopeptide repeat protein [Chloroflexota bacterium]